MKILSCTHQIVINNYKMGEGYDKKVYDMAISYQYDQNRRLGHNPLIPRFRAVEAVREH